MIKKRKINSPNSNIHLDEANKGISFIPRFFMVSISVYVPCGVPVVTYGKGFVTLDVFLYSLYISFPIVLLFAIPFWTYIVINLEKWTNTIEDTKTSSEKVNSSSMVTLDGVQNLSLKSNIQVKSTSEISATTDKLLIGMKEILNNAYKQQESLSKLHENMQTLEDITNDVVQEVERTQIVAKDVERIAKEGKTAMNEMNSSIGSITQSAKEMNAILSIISDISKRTNLLALNASIEAARAGESGWGFAVVADEIAKLADNTASSLHQIQSLVNSSVTDIQKGHQTTEAASSQFHNIISSIDDIIHKMNLLSSKINSQHKSSKAVNESVKEVFERSKSIQVSTEQQQKATGEIEKLIFNINDVTNAIVSCSDGLSNNTEKVTCEMEELKKKISFFKTE